MLKIVVLSFKVYNRVKMYKHIAGSIFYVFSRLWIGINATITYICKNVSVLSFSHNLAACKCILANVPYF